MSLNWNFQRGGGVQTKKTLRVGSMDIFWNNTMSLKAKLNAKKKNAMKVLNRPLPSQILVLLLPSKVFPVAVFLFHSPLQFLSGQILTVPVEKDKQIVSIYLMLRIQSFSPGTHSDQTKIQIKIHT